MPAFLLAGWYVDYSVHIVTGQYHHHGLFVLSVHCQAPYASLRLAHFLLDPEQRQQDE